jgi:HEPN domain-containing protein
VVEKFWFEKAKEFLEIAKNNKEKYPWLSCFASQQSVEFALKGILVKYKGSYPFTHDLGELLDLIGREFSLTIQPDILKDCDFLTPHYTQTRYSMISNYNLRKAESCINSAERVLNWLSNFFNEIKEII